MTVANISDKFKDDDEGDNEFEGDVTYHIIEVENGYILEEGCTGKTYCFSTKFDLMNHLNCALTEDDE